MNRRTRWYQRTKVYQSWGTNKEIPAQESRSMIQREPSTPRMREVGHNRTLQEELSEGPPPRHQHQSGEREKVSNQIPISAEGLGQWTRRMGSFVDLAHQTLEINQQELNKIRQHIDQLLHRETGPTNLSGGTKQTVGPK